MKIISTLDASWMKYLLQWIKDPDVDKFIIGDSGVEGMVQRINSGELVFFGIQDGDWRGFATLKPYEGKTAELSLYARGRSKEAINAIFEVLEHLPVDKVFMKMQADRFRNWESYTLKKWQRGARLWGLEFAGLVGDPIGNKSFNIIMAKGIDHVRPI